MSSSSSEDEMGEAFRESACCDYITQLVEAPKKTNLKGTSGLRESEFNTSGNDQKSSMSSRINSDELDKIKETGFEKFLAARLACRLDDSIKIVEKKKRSLPVDGSSDCGIRLFSSSPKVTELIDTANPSSWTVSPKRAPVPQISIDYNGRAEEAAVSPQWVSDPSNTAFWKANKKPRVMSAKVLKTLSNGGLECLPLSSM